MLVKKEWKPFEGKEIDFEEAERFIKSLIAGFGSVEIRYFHTMETESRVFFGSSTYVNKILFASKYKVVAWFGFAALHGMIFDSVILDDYRWLFCRNETLQDGTCMMSGIEVSAPTAPAQAMKVIEEYEGTDKEVHKTMMHRLGYMLKGLVYDSRRKARLESRAASKTRPKKRRPTTQSQPRLICTVRKTFNDSITFQRAPKSAIVLQAQDRHLEILKLDLFSKPITLACIF